MNSGRRSFLKRIASGLAAVAMAPALCRLAEKVSVAVPEIPKWALTQEQMQTALRLIDMMPPSGKSQFVLDYIQAIGWSPPAA